MTLREKLAIIKKHLNLSQTQLADRLGVSFVAFNNWWTGKSLPRLKRLEIIDELFLEVTGQKIISLDRLKTKKVALQKRKALYRSVIKTILDNVDIRDEYVLNLTYNSNSIEGSTLTEKETAAVLFDNIALPDKTLIEQLEAKNHQTALLYMFKSIVERKKVDQEFILKLHGILMNGIRSDAGLYRNHAVRIVGVNLPTANYLKIPYLMNILVKEINRKKVDPIYHAAYIHSHFEKIHPFADGNGRVGRLIMNAMFLRQNFPPAIIRQQLKRLYYIYLYKAQTKEDYSQLEDFLCDGLENSFDVLERK